VLEQLPVDHAGLNSGTREKIADFMTMVKSFFRENKNGECL